MEHLTTQALQRKFIILSFLLVTMLGSVPYIVYAIVYPELSLETLLIYRRDGDFSYLPQIRALADLRFGEAILPEHLGEGVRSFPFAALALHALGFRVFGPIGLIVSDSIIYVVYYACLLWFFQELRVHRLMAAVFSITILFLLPFQYHLPLLIPGPLVPIFSGFRFPRPFVTEIFLLGSMTLSLSVFTHSKPFQQRRQWLVLTILLVLLMQADIYPAMTLMLHVGSLCGMRFLVKKDERPQLLRLLPVLLIPGLVCSLPFLIQRLGEIPDIPRRFGVFSVPRLPLHMLEEGTLRFVVITGISIGTMRMLHTIKTETPRGYRQISILLILGIWSFFVQPVSCILLGATIQPYHFAIQFETISSYTLLGSLILAFQHIIRRSRFRTIRISSRHMFVALSVIVGIEGASYIAMFPALPQKHVRFDFTAYNALPDYRNNFARLLKELNNPRYATYNVLATLDIQVFVWWTTFHTGYAFLTDPFNSAVSDNVIENRLIRFCRINGINSAEQFANFIQQRHINLWWLGHNKYQASKAHTFAPLSEYPETIRQAIQEEPWGAWYGCWRLHIPESELSRLKQKFNSQAGADISPPDIIILTQNDLASGLQPSDEGFTRSYVNDVFHVYTR